MDEVERLENLIREGITESGIKALGAVLQILEEGFEGCQKRKIGLDNIDGLTISTVNTCDYGPETAIIDSNDTYTVERYENIENAKIGHIEWCKKSKTLTEVVGLDYGFIPGPGVVELVRTK